MCATTCITEAEDTQRRHTIQMIGILPHQTLMKDTPCFLQKRNNWTIPILTNPTTQPQTQEDFQHLLQQQHTLFYNQHTFKWALWNEEKQRFDSTY